MEIAIIADTHLPGAGRHLPSDCISRLKAADLIVHAGDLIRVSVLRELASYGPTAAVHGNVDDAELRALLPARRTIGADDARVGVVHDAGPARRRLERLRAWFPEADAVVFGHSHIPLHERAPDGFQIFNPGSPTERRRAPRHSMGIARISHRAVTFELIALD
jgi:putative phosphoesterase